MSTALAIGCARSLNDRVPIEVSEYLLVNLTFQPFVDGYADDINYSDFTVDREVINVPFHTFIAPSMPSHSLFERNRTLS